MGNAPIDYALLYISLGWPVFPLVPRTKEPATAHGFKDASTDEAQIRRWWGKNPDYGIGIATGGGRCVIDVDDKPEKHGGLLGSDFLREWEQEHGEISETVCCKTPTGGMHYYLDVGDTYIGGCQSDTIFIDLRCDGNYVVAPPSIHPDTGTAYTWDISPEDMPPAKATDVDKACIQWVYDHRRGAGKDGKRKKPAIPSKMVREGEGRNNFLYEQGCSARGRGSDDDMIAAYLEALNSMKCSPPLPDAEVRKIVNSVCTKPIGMSDEAKEQARRGRPRKFEHNRVARKLIDEFGACLIDGETPAIRLADGRYSMGWDAFDTAIIGMHDDCTESNRREAKAYIKAMAPHRSQSSPFMIGFENGVLDVRTMEFRDYGSDDLIPNVIPHDWNPNARSALLDSMLCKIACESTDTMLNLTEFIGMCMMRDVTVLPYFPVLIGEGSNGKSTYIKLLEGVVGRDNISGLQPKEISAHFMGMHIVGKTANLGDDIANGYLDDKDCSVIKSVATGDLMFTDVKGSKGFHFRPYCTMVFSCNAFPRLADTTPGFMRRLFPVEFNAVFSRDDADFDPLIGTKLQDEEVLQYACVLGVDGLRRALDQNGPTPNDISNAMKAEIVNEANTGMQWINDENITAEHLIGMTKAEAYAEYQAWCERNGYSKTAMGSGTLSALFGTYFRLKCSKSDHREYSTGRKTVKVYERKVP